MNLPTFPTVTFILPIGLEISGEDFEDLIAFVERSKGDLQDITGAGRVLTVTSGFIVNSSKGDEDVPNCS